MKTISALLVTLAFAANAAGPQSTPNVAISCPQGICQFDFTNLDPSTTYAFAGVNTTSQFADAIAENIIPAGDGSYNFTWPLSSGTWEFTLSSDRKNGKSAHNPVFDEMVLVP